MATRVQTDLVTIRFRTNTAGVRIITGFCVIGSSIPCQGTLIINRRVRTAARCLLSNGFILIGSSRQAVVYQRTRIV